jgi:hypothetical protein
MEQLNAPCYLHVYIDPKTTMRKHHIRSRTVDNSTISRRCAKN